MTDSELPNLPDGWRWATCGDLLAFVTSGSRGWAEHYSPQGALFLRMGNLDHGTITLDLADIQRVNPPEGAEGTRTRVKPDDILVSITADVGMIGLVPQAIDEAYINQHVALARPLPSVFSPYLAWYLACEHGGQKQLKDLQRGATKVGLGLDDIREIKIPYPPLTEQLKIVSEIDELLSDLDAGVAALERVQTKLAHYRAAVLKAAVVGDLTADWRAQHPDTEPASALLARILTERRRRWEEDQLRKFQEAGKEPPKNWKARYREPQLPEKPKSPNLPDSWIWTNVDTLSVPPIINGISVKGSDSPPGIAALRLNAMSENGFDYSKRRWLPLRQKDVDDLWIEEGDFFVCRGNGSKKLVGRGTTAQEPPDAVIFPDTMMRLRFVPVINGTRLFAVLWASSCARTQIEKAAKTTAGIWKIAQPDLAKIVLPLPPLTEQEAIVEAVEAQLSVIDHLEADIAAKLKSAQGLRQSILRHAFTGQLVPQDPNDEPASELLKRIATEREERARLTATARLATKTARRKAGAAKVRKIATSKNPRKSVNLDHK